MGPCATGADRQLTAETRPPTATLPVDTPAGPATVSLDLPAEPPGGLLLLGHGAGGGVETPDLLAATGAALEHGWAVGRMTQPYRLAGRRAPSPAAVLDQAWLVAVAAVREEPSLRSVPLLVGGRSSGARVACRTAVSADAAAVLALAFPLRPPRRPEADRSAELAAAGRPVDVVQGERDAFGGPPLIEALRLPGVTVRAVPGADHALRTAAARATVREAVAALVASVSRAG